MKDFLAKRGLELNQNKTKIVNIQEGFDYLRFQFCRKPWNVRFNKVSKTGITQSTVLLIKPSKKSILNLRNKLRAIITMSKPIIKIITQANSILRGWAEYFRISYHSNLVFIKFDHWVYKKMMKWVYYHKGSIHRTTQKYLVVTYRRKWNWGLSKKTRLINLGEIATLTYRMLKHDMNPYIRENTKYFNERKAMIKVAKFKAMIYKMYNHTCTVCQTSLHNGEQVDLHHIIPIKDKGVYQPNNIMPLHQVCHQQVTHNSETMEKLKELRVVIENKEEPKRKIRKSKK